MTKDETELAALEVAMQVLVRQRYDAVREAEKMIVTANRRFDREALKLSRKITTLREKLDVQDSISKQLATQEPDPDWDTEDQGHFEELTRLAAIRNSRH